MKINMADNEYFPIGTILSCTLCSGKKIEGEVISFDYETKSLALKSHQTTSAKSNTHDYHLINLNHVKHEDVEVIKEAPEQVSPPLSNLHLQKIQQRLSTNLEEKKRKANYVGKGVTPLAQKLFHQITKTISDVRWNDQIIVVMDSVEITPPYESDSVRGKGQAVQHVKKLVDKFYRDENRESSVSSNSSSS